MEETKMFVQTFRNAVLALLIALPISVSSAAGFEIDIAAATPVGSWMTSEALVTDHRGRQTVMVMKPSMLGTEERNGQTHCWVETVMDMFEVKNGERQKKQDRLVLKALIAGSLLFSDNPENLSIDLKSNYVELIVQTGDTEPIRMREIGRTLDVVLDVFGGDFTQTWESGSFEAVTVSAGTFHTQKLLGSGTSNSRFGGNSSTAHTIWYTQSVPFGVVKSEVRMTDKKGKVTTQSIRLLDYGTSGAHSLITSTPVELPQLTMPSLRSLFGR
jgi:hypothetical protein